MVRHFISYAVSPDRETWAERIENGCAVLESIFPLGRLMVTIEGSKFNVHHVVIKDRQKYLQKRLKRKGLNFSLHNGRVDHIKSDRNEECIKDSHVSISGQFYEWGEIVYNLNISYQTETWEECEHVLVATGDAVEAYNACTMTWDTFQTLRAYYNVLWRSKGKLDQLESDGFYCHVTPLITNLAAIGRELPCLSQDPLAVRECAAQPKELGWLNYWSAETCKYLGFPDEDRDRDLLAHSYQTAGGAWLVKLCPEPLDLTRPDHLAIFADVYDRFPKLGLRTPKV